PALLPIMPLIGKPAECFKPGWQQGGVGRLMHNVIARTADKHIVFVPDGSRMNMRLINARRGNAMKLADQPERQIFVLVVFGMLHQLIVVQDH
ncbi:hypothetical protein, partial [Pseudomonas viridiflava]|uniref:hypothetical protein n=1 Tax=Pseudomonas viridiflava TaxID=33069 RepID=UPI00197D1E32